jgi:hypothetical protein
VIDFRQRLDQFLLVALDHAAQGHHRLAAPT